MSNIAAFAQLLREKYHPELLDNLGITVNVRSLPSYPAYREAQCRLFGHGRLGRWWMRVVFPRIKPQEWERRRVEFERRGAIIRQELFIAVIDKAGLE